MRLVKSAVAACAAVGAVAAFSAPALAAPVAASDPCLDNPNVPTCVNDVVDRVIAVINTVHSDPCVSQVNVPTCVNDAGSRALAAFETARTIYNNDIQPLGNGPACQVYTLLTGKPCPGLVPKL